MRYEEPYWDKKSFFEVRYKEILYIVLPLNIVAISLMFLTNDIHLEDSILWNLLFVFAFIVLVPLVFNFLLLVVFALLYNIFYIWIVKSWTDEENLNIIKKSKDELEEFVFKLYYIVFYFVVIYFFISGGQLSEL